MKFKNNVNLDTNNISGLPLPSANSNPTIYSQYVKLPIRNSCYVATTADIGGSYTANGGNGGTDIFTGAPTTIDGKTVTSAGLRILLKNQSSQTQNGIYVVLSSGIWERAEDMSGTSSNILKGICAYIEEGTTNKGKVFILTSDNGLSSNIITANSHNIIWQAVGGSISNLNEVPAPISGYNFNNQTLAGLNYTAYTTNIGSIGSSGQKQSFVSDNFVFIGTQVAFGSTPTRAGGSNGQNVFIGYEAGLDCHATCNNGIAIGANSGYGMTGSHGIALGYNSRSGGGGGGVAIGGFAGNSLNSGTENVFIGKNAGYFHTNGSYNIGIGGFAFSQNSNATGLGNICLGYDSKTTGTINYGIAIGYLTQVSASESISMGYNSSCSGNKSVVIGYAASTSGANSIAIGNGASVGTANTCRLGGTGGNAVGFEFSDWWRISNSSPNALYPVGSYDLGRTTNKIKDFYTQTVYTDIIFNSISTVISGSSVTISANASDILLYDATGTNFTYNLPSLASVLPNKTFLIKDAAGGAGTNNITITANGADLIEGNASIVINTNYGKYQIMKKDNSNWIII